MIPESPPSPGFDSLGLHPLLLAALTALGYEEPTPIQRAALPPLLEGRDVLGQAATGTGKTAAFALPLLQRLAPGACGPFETSALVLVPTRELAMQVAEAIFSYGKGREVRVLPVYGGQEIGDQLRRLKRGIDVVVATPGRALDHLRRKSLKLEKVGMVVLDEADEMLDMGFADDLEAILDALPAERQTALFSATLPPRIAAMAERHLKDPVRLRIAKEKVPPGTLPKIRQTAYLVPREYKNATLGRVLDVEAPRSAIVFCRTRTEVDALTESLNGHGFRADALHGGLSQEQRDRVMKRFRTQATELLIATDVAARGLDIEKLSHVINYDVPTSPEAYVHRIGRTGRAGREGVAITLAEPREGRLLKNIERLTRTPIAIATVPTVADLRARRIELTRASIREALVAGGLDPYRGVVETLSAEFDARDIAAAAVKLVHSLSGESREGDEIEIPLVKASERVPPPKRRDAPSQQRREPTGHRPGARARPQHAASGRSPRAETASLFIGAGREVGMRPADLVGAIANEAGVPSKQIGAIQIGDGYSLVEVPEESADDVVNALSRTTIRGKKVRVRRDRSEGHR